MTPHVQLPEYRWSTDPQRAPFLRSIDATLEDDTVRLAYADWIEERDYPLGDRDVATVDFIRQSCGKLQYKERQTADEGRWLARHWTRLIPTVAARVGPKSYRREGRWLQLSARYQMGHMERDFRFFFRVEFWRGFVRRVVFDSAYDLEFLLPVLLRDQPLAYPEISEFCWAAQVADADGKPVWGSFDYHVTPALAGAAFRYFNCGDDPYDVYPQNQLIVYTGPMAREKAQRECRTACRLYARVLTGLAHVPQPEEAVA
jgi:uncharacterized protein (TIGR02996 family)